MATLRQMGNGLSRAKESSASQIRAKTVKVGKARQSWANSWAEQRNVGQIRAKLGTVGQTNVGQIRAKGKASQSWAKQRDVGQIWAKKAKGAKFFKELIWKKNLNCVKTVSCSRALLFFLEPTRNIFFLRNRKSVQFFFFSFFNVRFLIRPL